MEANTLVDRIYELLKQKILRQEFTQNQKLNLTTLAHELKVSNTPLREAISRLEKVGLVKIVPYRGTYVRGLSAPEVAETYDVRIALEILAARLVAARQPPETLAQLNHVHQQYQTAFANDDHDQVKEHDLEFHRLIAQASGNKTLVDFLQMLADWVTVFMQFRLPPPRAPELLISEHVQILAAIHGGQPSKAGEAMQQHLVAGKIDLLHHLANQLEESNFLGEYPDVWGEDQ